MALIDTVRTYCADMGAADLADVVRDLTGAVDYAAEREQMALDRGDAMGAESWRKRTRERCDALDLVTVWLAAERH